MFDNVKQPKDAAAGGVPSDPRARAHRARANTPRGRQTSVIHSARRPVQPSPERAHSRPLKPTMASRAAELNCCSSILMP